MDKWCGMLEKGDRENEDPFSLSPYKSLKNYWLHYNTWSIDGLPGFRQMPEITARANEDIVRKAMADTGLNYDDTFIARRGSFSSSVSHLGSCYLQC